MPSLEKTFCTTRQAADLLGVSLRTTQLWVESGLLEAWKTSGGHRRIVRESVERLLYKNESARPRLQPQIPEPCDISQDLKILVVEDDSALSRLYMQVISHWPVRSDVTIAGSGVEALVKIGRERPDFLITDLLMPHMDGFGMLRILRSMPEMADMAIAVVTGLDVSEIEKRGGLPGTIRVFPKPVPFSALLDIAQSIAKDKHANGGEHAN